MYQEILSRHYELLDYLEGLVDGPQNQRAEISLPSAAPAHTDDDLADLPEELFQLHALRLARLVR